MFYAFIFGFVIIFPIATAFFSNPGGFMRTVGRRFVLGIALLIIALSFGFLAQFGFAWTVVGVGVSVPFIAWYKTLRSRHLA